MPWPFTILRSPTASTRWRLPVLNRYSSMAVCLMLVPFSGCQQWPGTNQAKQFQQDSERLLNEFKAEKQRADELAAKNQMLEQRLAETEKQYALQNLAGSRNRTGNRATDTKLSIGGAAQNGQLSQSQTSRSTAPSVRPNTFTGPGLPDVRPGTDSRFTSANNQSNGAPANNASRGASINFGANPYAPQWRPIQK